MESHGAHTLGPHPSGAYSSCPAPDQHRGSPSRTQHTEPPDQHREVPLSEPGLKLASVLSSIKGLIERRRRSRTPDFAQS